MILLIIITQSTQKLTILLICDNEIVDIFVNHLCNCRFKPSFVVGFLLCDKNTNGYHLIKEMASSTRLLAVESSCICLSFLMVCLAVLRIFWVVLSTTLVRWFCRVNIKLFSAVSMAEFHSALNFGSSFSITRGLIVIAIFAGVLPLASAFCRAARCDLALSRVSVSFRYSDLCEEVYTFEKFKFLQNNQS